MIMASRKVGGMEILDDVMPRFHLPDFVPWEYTGSHVVEFMIKVSLVSILTFT